MGNGQINQAFRALGSLFIILAQATKTVEPAEGTLNNAAFGLNDKSSLLSTVGDLSFNRKQALTPTQQSRRVVAAIEQEQAQALPQGQPSEQPFGRDFVLLIRRMHQHPQQPALGVHRYLSFAAFLTLVRVKTYRPLFSAVCTDWLSIITTLGSASRSSSSRICTRSASLMVSRT